MKKYYVAYGSNLNVRQMNYRCPGAKPYMVTRLTGYELLFKGSKTGNYLTIEKKPYGKVPVVIWEVDERHERSLDRYEGFPNFYYKKDVKFKDYDGKTKYAFVYIMHEDRKLGRPTEYYMNTCRQGYKDFGFDCKYLEEAYNRSVKEIEVW